MPSCQLPRLSRAFSSTASPRAEAYLLSAARTPTARFGGSLTSLPGPELGAAAIRAALDKSGVPADRINEVYMGNVLSAAVGQAPARQAAVKAGLPHEVDATTVNKVCASGLKAVSLAVQGIRLGESQAAVAGGFESMSRVPYYLPRPGQLPLLGAITLADGLLADGLTDAYDLIHMGVCAENTARNHGVSREDQDAYAIASYRRAQAAWNAGAFADEVVPVTVPPAKRGASPTTVDRDEGYDTLREDKISSLRPAFIRDGTGTVTAANASTFNDGGSALVVGNKAIAAEYANGGRSRVLAQVLATADAATQPVDFPVAPSKAVPLALARAGVRKEDVAVWEFNEAFAAVIKANEKVGTSSFSLLLLSLEHPSDIHPDTWPARCHRQPARWRHLNWPRPRLVRCPHPHHTAAYLESWPNRRGGHLQRRWRRDSHGRAPD